MTTETELDASLEYDEIRIESEEVQSDESRKMASGLHSFIITSLAGYLTPFVRDKKLGRTFESSITFNFIGHPPKRMPDFAFVSRKKLPKMLDEEITVVPDLAVEVVSKNDTVYEVDQKTAHYQEVGVPLIWIIHPTNQTVTVYHLADGPVGQIIGIDGELDGETVIPGFRLAVNKLFEDEDWD